MLFVFALVCVSGFFAILAACATYDAIRERRLEGARPAPADFKVSNPVARVAKRRANIAKLERMYAASDRPDDWAQGANESEPGKGGQG